MEHNDLRNTTSPLRSQMYLDKQSPNGNSLPMITRNPGDTRNLNVFTRPPMGKESVTVTRTDGQRLYLYLKDQPNDCGSKGRKVCLLENNEHEADIFRVCYYYNACSYSSGSKRRV
jgi:hypothetical protein